MAALACPAVNTLGSAGIVPACRAAARAWLARSLLPMAILPSPDCAISNFDRREKERNGLRLLPLASLLRSCVTEA